MKISEILKNLDVVKVYNERELFIENFTIDSREKVKKGLYFGIVGENVDGNMFYKDALTNGCECVIIEKNLITNNDEKYLIENNKCVIIVKNTLKALECLAKYKRSINKIPIIAITGSAGKTSTKDLVHALLNEKYISYKTPGNKNNEIGLPLTLINLKNEEVAVLEMGMNHFGEISYLTNIVEPDVVIINNVGTAHIGNLGSQENILKAKLEILEGLNDLGKVIINNDDQLLNAWAKENKNNYNIITYGLKEISDIKISDINLDTMSSSFTYNEEKFIIPIPGEQYISNALAAIAVGKIFEIDAKLMAKGLQNVELSNNRMDIKNKDGITIINDTYNANCDAVLYALKNLEKFRGRKIACLGDMLELGEFSKSLHEKIGDSIKAGSVDLLITVGIESKNIYNRAKDEVNAIHFDTNEKAIKYINEIKKEGDVFLFKASQGCKFIEIVNSVL